MRILQICKKLPWPLEDGESIAVYGLAKGLIHHGATIDLLAMNTSKHYRDELDARKHLGHYATVEVVDVDNSLTIKRLFSSLFSPSPIHVDRIRSKAFENTFIEMVDANKYDFILYETIYPSYLGSSISLGKNIKQVIRLHNVEHIIWERLCDNSSFLKSWYFKMQSKKIKRFELSQIAQVVFNIALSSVDKSKFERYISNSNILVSGVGLDPARYESAPRLGDEHNNLRLGFIGSMDWAPNAEGLNWFFDNVWQDPKVKSLENVEFHLAGRGASQLMNDAIDKRMIIHDYVDDAIEFISSLDVLVVPLFSGSGQKVKIIEALALGTFVITTPIGMEGIEALEGQFAVFDTSDEFISTIEKLTIEKLEMNFSLVGQRNMYIISKNVYDNMKGYQKCTD